MINKNNEPLRIGIPEVGQGRFGTIALLKKAEVPVADRPGTPFTELIWFDKNTQAVRRPNDDQCVSLIEISTAPAGFLRQAVTSGILDLAIKTRRVPLETDRPDTLRLAIPGKTKTETLPGELILAEPLDPEILEKLRETGRLRGIAGFRNRLVASIVRASENAVQQAFVASLEASTRQASANYQAIQEGERPYLPY